MANSGSFKRGSNPNGANCLRLQPNRANFGCSATCCVVEHSKYKVEWLLQPNDCIQMRSCIVSRFVTSNSWVSENGFIK